MTFRGKSIDIGACDISPVFTCYRINTKSPGSPTPVPRHLTASLPASIIESYFFLCAYQTRMCVCVCVLQESRPLWSQFACHLRSLCMSAVALHLSPPPASRSVSAAPVVFPSRNQSSLVASLKQRLSPRRLLTQLAALSYFFPCFFHSVNSVR